MIRLNDLKFKKDLFLVLNIAKASWGIYNETSPRQAAAIKTQIYCFSQASYGRANPER